MSGCLLWDYSRAQGLLFFHPEIALEPDIIRGSAGQHAELAWLHYAAKVAVVKGQVVRA